jgi:hypothetical protein
MGERKVLHRGTEAFINMSQMTLAEMSITETTASPQHKLHCCLATCLGGCSCQLPM